MDLMDWKDLIGGALLFAGVILWIVGGVIMIFVGATSIGPPVWAIGGSLILVGGFIRYCIVG